MPFYSANAIARRPGFGKQRDPAGVQHLLKELDDDEIVHPAPWVKETWLTQFKRRVNDSPSVAMLDGDAALVTDIWKAKTYTTSYCMEVMHAASEERRAIALEFLDSHPERDAYPNLMRAFIESERNGGSTALSNFTALYDALTPHVLTDTQYKIISQIAIVLSDRRMNLSALPPEELSRIRAVLAVSAFCCITMGTEWYVREISTAEFSSSFAYGGKKLNDELERYVETHHEDVDRIIAALRSSTFKMDVEELDDIISNGMSIALLDGML